MKTLLVSINSKFIHTNMAVRYLKANCDFDISIKEYTIKDEVSFILKDILAEKPKIIGFSCYIWNISLIKEIINKIKAKLPETIIIIGGPEVSYEYDDYLLEGFVDYVVINEGEITFNLLISSIIHNQKKFDIPNLAFLSNGKIFRTKIMPIKDLDNIKSPYYFLDDIPYIDKKVQYIELSRGCPYQCSYCLASLEKGLRFFDTDYVFSVIDYLVEKGAKTIKFLDRSFNANKKMALDFFKRLVEKDYKDVVFQFEINGDVLSEEIINFLVDNVKENYVRLELGIQSTNDKVNRAINRYQDTAKLIKNIRMLQKSNIILHLDLIAGLPYEDLSSFVSTFNEIFTLFADELQLGFLKMLKGTKMKDDAVIHDYFYHHEPPYEIISNKYISEYELNIIHRVETFLDIYWNKHFMKNTMINIFKNHNNPFYFFKELPDYYDISNLKYQNYQLYDLFINLESYLMSTNRYTSEVEDSLKMDYLSYNKIKPKIFWKNDFKKQEMIRDFHQNFPQYNLDELYKYALVTRYKEGFLIVLFLPDNKKILYWDKLKEELVECH